MIAMSLFILGLPDSDVQRPCNVITTKSLATSMLKEKFFCSVSQNEASPSAFFVISASEHAHNVIPFYRSSRRFQT